jgi:ribonuclease VapC
LIVVDSSAVISILLEEPDFVSFVFAIANSGRAVISTANALEVVMVAVGKTNPIEIVAFEPHHWSTAVDAFMRFGRGRSHPAKLNFGDCMAYALAKSLDAPLLYKGDDFAKTDIRSALL